MIRNIIYSLVFLIVFVYSIIAYEKFKDFGLIYKSVGDIRVVNYNSFSKWSSDNFLCSFDEESYTLRIYPVSITYPPPLQLVVHSNYRNIKILSRERFILPSSNQTPYDFRINNLNFPNTKSKVDITFTIINNFQQRLFPAIIFVQMPNNMDNDFGSVKSTRQACIQDINAYLPKYKKSVSKFCDETFPLIKPFFIDSDTQTEDALKYFEGLANSMESRELGYSSILGINKYKSIIYSIVDTLKQIETENFADSIDKIQQLYDESQQVQKIISDNINCDKI